MSEAKCWSQNLCSLFVQSEVNVVDSPNTVVSVVCLCGVRVDECNDVLLVDISVLASMLVDCVIIEVSAVACSGLVVDGALLVSHLPVSCRAKKSSTLPSAAYLLPLSCSNNVEELEPRVLWWWSFARVVILDCYCYLKKDVYK